MSQFERGGMSIGRLPADVGNVPDDAGALVDDVADDDASRVAGLPDHELDPVDTTGGGLNTHGGVTYGDAAQEGGDALDTDASAAGEDFETGLPLGGDAGTERRTSDR